MAARVFKREIIGEVKEPLYFFSQFLRKVLEEDPLYHKHSYEEVSFTNYDKEWPAKISWPCSICKKEKVFEKRKSYGVISSEVNGSSYKCVDCSKGRVCFFIELNEHDFWVQKIGQLPAWSIEIPKDLEKYLEKDVFLYKRALICISQSYGLGALAYMRRVIENKTNKLFKDIRSICKQDGLSEKELKKFDAVEKDRNFTSRLKFAKERLPQRLCPGGINPIGILHSVTSEGIHGYSDEKCLTLAMRCRDVLEYLVKNMHQPLRENKVFVEKIKGLLDKK